MMIPVDSYLSIELRAPTRYCIYYLAIVTILYTSDIPRTITQHIHRYLSTKAKVSLPPFAGQCNFPIIHQQIEFDTLHGAKLLSFSCLPYFYGWFKPFFNMGGV